MTSADLHIIVGLGVTGASCARYLSARGVPIAVTDTRASPPGLDEFTKTHPTVPLSLGRLDTKLLEKASTIVLSPGVSLKEPAIAAQIKRGVRVIGDIELFAQAVTVPVIGITGTNAKSTVTTLVGEMAKTAGVVVQVGGNLGVPALDLWQANPSADLFVLELSSFQLETTASLKLQVASILNISPDHMDRYTTFADYQKAKHRIYEQCHLAVCNRDDPLTYCQIAPPEKRYFTLSTPKENEFGVIAESKTRQLAFGENLLLSVDEMPVKGKHYQANALAALAIGHSFGLAFEPMLHTLKTFKGLPHRCEFIREHRQVKWYNDSKGTNVGATQAAMSGLGSEIAGKLVLIAGGVGKQADFAPLVPMIEKYARHVVLIGEAKEDLAAAINHRAPISFAVTMEEAVLLADQAAQPGDSVLLSPACASFDMFKHYVHRGEVFTALVKQL